LGQRSAIEDGAKAFALEKLRNQKGSAIVFADVVDGENVGMIERGNGLRFLLETAKAIRIMIERFREDFQGDIAPEPSVASTVDFAHAARTQLRLNRVWAELRACG
jgi:hypothetical protein